MLIKSGVIVHQHETSKEDLTDLKDDEEKMRIQGRTTGLRKRIDNDNDVTSNDSNFSGSHPRQELFERRLKNVSTFSDITEITPQLFLCGAVALRGNILEDLNITCVINATRELPDTPLPDTLEKNTLYLRVNIDDKTDSNILPWLNLVTDIINQVKLAGGKTLIHCVAGISRSATLCLAYLIRQLVEFEKDVTGKQTVSMVQSNFTNTWIPQVYEDEYQRFEDLKHSLRKNQT